MYPHITVRYLPAVYGTFGVKFVESDQADLQSDEVEDTFVVACEKPYTLDEELTPEARQALLDVVQCASQKSGHRLCVVFGKGDCVYVEPEGASKTLTAPPSGGIQCLRFPIRLK